MKCTFKRLDVTPSRVIKYVIDYLQVQLTTLSTR